MKAYATLREDPGFLTTNKRQAIAVFAVRTSFMGTFGWKSRSTFQGALVVIAGSVGSKSKGNYPKLALGHWTKILCSRGYMEN